MIKIKVMLLLIFSIFSFSVSANKTRSCASVKKWITKTILEKKTEQTSFYINAFLIRPELETQEEALKKINDNITGTLITQGDEIIFVLEKNNCVEANELAKNGFNVVDFNGKFIIPGLHDLHIHNFGVNSDIPNSPIFSENGTPVKHLDYPGPLAMNYRMAYAGVTSHLDLMSFNRETKIMRDQQRMIHSYGSAPSKNYMPTSNIFMSAGIFRIEGGHHGDISFLVGKDKHTTIAFSKDKIVEQKDDIQRLKALRKVISDHINEFHPITLKITYDHNPHRPGHPKINNVNRQLLGEFISIAKQIDPKIKIICHVGIWQDVVDCIEQGAQAVTHLPYSSDNDLEYQIPKGIFEKMKAKNITVIPTMTVYMEGGFVKNSLFNIFNRTEPCSAGDENCECILTVCTKSIESGELSGNKHFFEDPLLKAVTPTGLLNSYLNFDNYAGNHWLQWGVENNKLGYRQKTFRKLMNSGVRVLSGTDTMWEATFFGFSLHRELELMQLTNDIADIPYKPITQMEILKTSTSNVHDFLNHKRGRLKIGFKADFLVLNSSPLDNILNTRDINSVVINGIIVDREKIVNQDLMKVQ